MRSDTDMLPVPDSKLGNSRQDLIRLVKCETEDLVLSLSVLNGASSLLTRIFRKRLPAAVVGCIISALVFLLSVLASLIFRRPFLPVIRHLLVLSAISGFTLVVVKAGYGYGESTFFFLVDYFLDEEAFVTVKAWILDVFNRRRQVAVSILFAVVGCALAGMLDLGQSSVPIFLSSYVVSFFAGLALGNGAYLALSVPTITRVMSKHRFRLYPFAPSESVFFRRARSTFGTMTLMYAGVLSAVLLELYQLNPFGSEITKRIALGCLLFGLTVVSYSFLYPHHYCSRIIKREKLATLDTLQARIEQTYQKHTVLNSDALDEIKAAIELYEMVRSSPGSSLDFTTWRQYLGSVVVPTATFLSGILDWNDIIAKVLS